MAALNTAGAVQLQKNSTFEHWGRKTQFLSDFYKTLFLLYFISCDCKTIEALADYSDESKKLMAWWGFPLESFLFSRLRFVDILNKRRRILFRLEQVNPRAPRFVQITIKWQSESGRESSSRRTDTVC